MGFPGYENGPPEPAWLECSGCCDWTRAAAATFAADGEALCRCCAEDAADREADVCADADDLGIGGVDLGGEGGSE